MAHTFFAPELIHPPLDLPETPYHHLLRLAAERAPDGRAIIFHNLRLTYRDLVPLLRNVLRQTPLRQLRHIIITGTSTVVLDEMPGLSFAQLLQESLPKRPDPVEIKVDDLFALPYSSGTTGLPRAVWKSPEETARVLRDGWLYTGDIGHLDASGWLFLVDRKKEMIKYKAFSIAPAELEALLLEHPAVLDAAVIGVPDDEAGEVPKGFVALRPGQQVTAEVLIVFVNGKLASYKSRTISSS